MNTINSIGQDVVSVIFSILIWVIVLRLLLQAFRTDFYNPVAQAIVRFTAFLDPLRRVLGARGGIDLATLLALVLLQVLQLGMIVAMRAGEWPGIGLLLAFSVPELLHTLLNVFFWTIIASVVASWLAPGGHSPAVQLIYSLTEPLLAPARRLLPPLGGLDFSPVIVLLLINVADKYGVPAMRQLVSGLVG